LTTRESSLYSNETAFHRQTRLDIATLEAKIDELIQVCDELERRQASMEADKAQWLAERTRLLEKNELAKNKVEAMIMRLKALEQE